MTLINVQDSLAKMYLIIVIDLIGIIILSNDPFIYGKGACQLFSKLQQKS